MTSITSNDSIPLQTLSSSKQVLRAESLKKSYKNRHVIKDVSLSVQVGEIVGLLGPNGCGKTTCFYMVVGLIKPDAGIIKVNDKVVNTLPMHQRAKMGIGYLPQDASIFRKMTVMENIMAILQLRKDLTALQRQEKLELLLSEFHITHIRNNLGISLSGGERRRVEIARALAMDPLFLLLDEPFAGVDPISVEDMQNVIMYLKDRGVGILITDHNVRETLRVCSRAYILSEGKILIEGTAEQIYANEQVQKVYLGKNFSDA